MSANVDEVLTMEEAARFAKVSTNHLRTIITSGKLKAIDIGSGRRRYFRIVKKDLLTFFGIDTGSHGEAGSTGRALSQSRTPPTLPGRRG